MILFNCLKSFFLGPKIPDYARDTTTSRLHNSRQNSKLDQGVPKTCLPGESMELPSFVSETEVQEITEEKDNTNLNVSIKVISHTFKKIALL